jgi:hypothetical protein
MNRRAHGRMNPTNVRRSWGARQESGKPEHKGLGYPLTLAGSKGLALTHFASVWVTPRWLHLTQSDLN